MKKYSFCILYFMFFMPSVLFADRLCIESSRIQYGYDEFTDGFHYYFDSYGAGLVSGRYWLRYPDQRTEIEQSLEAIYNNPSKERVFVCFEKEKAVPRGTGWFLTDGFKYSHKTLPITQAFTAVFIPDWGMFESDLSGRVLNSLIVQTNVIQCRDPLDIKIHVQEETGKVNYELPFRFFYGSPNLTSETSKKISEFLKAAASHPYGIAKNRAPHVSLCLEGDYKIFQENLEAPSRVLFETKDIYFAIEGWFGEKTRCDEQGNPI